MADHMALHTVYNHFLTTYAPKTTSPYDTHKKSELRNIYKMIVNQSKESPLYMIKPGRDIQAYAIGVKENARSLKNVISSLSDAGSADILNKKAASSTNSDIAEATFIGSLSEGEEISPFEVEVKSLATTQVNLGKYLEPDKMGLEPGTYSFDIHTGDLDYEFQFNIKNHDTNREIQDRLARLINKADIGVSASVAEDENGRSSLRLESVSTGAPESEYVQFKVSDDNTSKNAGVVDYLGIGGVSRVPRNASFYLNGVEHSSNSNQFTVDKKFELSLKGVCREGETVEIGLKPDVESLTENIGQLVDGYNSFIHKAMTYSSVQPKSMQLVGEMSRISRAYERKLDAVGLNLQEDGTIELDRERLEQAAADESSMDNMDAIRDFSNSLLRKSNQISLNPMEYIDKTVVAYKNPGKNFVNPYITSMYSGMLFNSYC